MWRLREYEEQYGVVIRPGWISNDVHMTVRANRVLITYRQNLEAHLVLLAVTTMIEVYRLRWVGVRFFFRYPLPSDDHEEATATARTRRDYRIAERHAVRRLVPDAMLEMAEREEWENWQLADASGLSEATCQTRVQRWREGRKPVINFSAFAPVDLDGSIPF